MESEGNLKPKVLQVVGGTIKHQTQNKLFFLSRKAFIWTVLEKGRMHVGHNSRLRLMRQKSFST